MRWGGRRGGEGKAECKHTQGLPIVGTREGHRATCVQEAGAIAMWVGRRGGGEDRGPTTGLGRAPALLLHRG